VLDRIDLRWVITTAVVVAVAAAGTAATMKQHDRASSKETTVEQVRSSRVDRATAVGQFEAPRHSPSVGAAKELPPFKSEALPPLSTPVFAGTHDSSGTSPSETHFWYSQSARTLPNSSTSGGNPMRGVSGGGAGGAANWSAGQRPPDSAHSPATSATVNSEAPNPAIPPVSAAPGSSPSPRVPPGTNAAPPIVPTMPPLAPVASALVPASAAMPGTDLKSFAILGGSAGAPVLNVSSDPLAPTPEPGSMILIGTGLIGIAGALRRRFR